MNIHEYQAKSILARYGVTVPKGEMTDSLDKVPAIIKKLPTPVGVVKAQIHAGGRGKGGGVKVGKNSAEIEAYAKQILHMQLVTPQTGKTGKKVNKILIEQGLNIKKEFYFSILIDRVRKMPLILSSTEGGMDIEEVAAKTPEKIIQEWVDPLIGLRPYQALRIAHGLGLAKIDLSLPAKAAKMFVALYKAFDAEDISLLEINPLIATAENEVVALDCKINLDDNALYRHPDNTAMRDLSEEEQSEIEASKHDLNFVKLDGNIGCLVNGAGLAMATMDIIKLHGGEPANFLDVGGTATQERVENALRLITQDPNVGCIFINIFGGIVRCDMIAQGIVAAFSNLKLLVPVVVRLRGNNAAEAQTIIKQSAFKETLVMIEDLSKAAAKSVELAKAYKNKK